MAAKASITKLSKESQDAIISFNKNAMETFSSNWNIRDKLRETDLHYAREKDLTEKNINARIQNLIGDTNALQNLTIPIIKPQVESAVAYQTSVFLSGHPIFGVVASEEHIDAATQMETILENQQVKDGWLLTIQQALRDGFKYNLGAVEVSWDSIKTAAIETTTNGAKPKEVIWEGNRLKKLDLYNTFWDTRVKPRDVAEHGEVVGYVEKISRIALKALINGLEEVILPNVTPAYESPTTAEHYIPQLSSWMDSTNLAPNTTNWLQWANLTKRTNPSIHYKDVYEKTTLYARILPSDFNISVPARNTPQIWKFVIINNSVLIHAERQTNAHNLLPIMFLQPYDDGLGYQTKSLADDVRPMQQVASSLMNSLLDARRRSVYDRTVYDPSKIAPSDMNSPNPISNIPIKPSAYGSDLRAAFSPFPYNDNQSGTVMAEIGSVNSLADAISGINKAQQGQFVKGNKTRTEYSDVMGNANARSQTISLALEDQFFTPLKEILKINILQYQGGTTLYNREAKQNLVIDPVTLRKAILEFKVSDGLIPSTKLIDGDAFQTALQVLLGAPSLGQEYNLGKLVSYLFKTQGADIAAFEKSEEQKQYEQAMSQWQQMAQTYLEQGQEFQVPQPNPADYGIDPSTGKPTKEEQEDPTIIEQVMQQEATENETA